MLLRTRSLGVLLAGLSLGMALPSFAQDAPAGGGGRGQFAGMQRASGEVTAVNGATITVKDEEGKTMQIVTTDNTRIMKGQGGGAGFGGGGGRGAGGGQTPATIKVSEIKVGDGLMGMGNLDAPNKTLHAAMIFATDAATVKAMKDNLGKTYIVGKVTAINVDDAKMTVERSDKVSQVIGFDESTSFQRGGRGVVRLGTPSPGAAPAAPAAGGESITLADIKVGDNVTGQGSVKAGTFVPKTLIVMTPGARRREGGDASAAPKQ